MAVRQFECHHCIKQFIDDQVKVSNNISSNVYISY